MHRILLTVAAFFLSIIIFAQSIQPSACNTAGNSVTINGTIHEWSVGEMVLVNTVTTPGFIITQGLQQPSYNAVNNPGTSAHPFSIYPNPAGPNLFIQPHLDAGSTLTVTCYDALGRRTFTASYQLINGSELQTLNMRGMAAGNYFLHVTYNSNGQPVSTTYKIVKAY
jgi:hypothetical protein